MVKVFRRLTLLLCVLFFVIPGCGKKVIVKISYDRPAEYSIPSSIKRLAVAEFGAMSRTDKRWGEVATDKLASALDTYNKKYHRYELVDRKRLKAILDERDTQIMVSDTGSAVKLGKIANVQAMIYGNVNVIAHDERASRRAFDPFSQSMRTVHYTKRYCLAAVNFTMDDINSSKTIATVTVTREYDSEKDNKKGGSFARMLGFGGDKLPPTDHVINKLIDQCMEVILKKISPHQVIVEEELARSSDKDLGTGNKLAAAGEYAEALDMYKRVISKGDGKKIHGALFNAGVVCEAMRKFKEAEAYYHKAVKTEPKQEYIDARKRVRDLLKAAE